LGSSSVTAPGSRPSSAVVVRGPSSGSAASASSSEKNRTAAGLSGRRPFMAYSRSTASAVSASQASP
jgi:hypothetical protein